MPTDQRTKPHEPIRIVTVEASWLEDIIQRAERVAQREEQLFAELKAIRDREPMTREMIAEALGVKSNSLDYYFNKGLPVKRIGKLICLCTRGALEAWVASDPVNFRSRTRSNLDRS